MISIVGRATTGNQTTATRPAPTWATFAAPQPHDQVPVTGVYTPTIGDLLVIAAHNVLVNTPPAPPATPAGLEPFHLVSEGIGNGLSLCIWTTHITGAPANAGTLWADAHNIDIIAIRGDPAAVVTAVSPQWASAAATNEARFPPLALTRKDGQNICLRWFTRVSGTIHPAAPTGDMPAPEGPWQQMTVQRAPWGTAQQRLQSWARTLTADPAEFVWTPMGTNALSRAVTLEVAVPAPVAVNRVKGWTGSAWRPIKAHTGSTWTDKVKAWDGSAWR